jgi:hypothetical protein
VAFHVVNFNVTAEPPIECDFWSADDGWKGFCKTLSIAVSGNSFEDAKKNMTTELQARIEQILQCAANCLIEARFRNGRGITISNRRPAGGANANHHPRRT